MRRAAEGRHDAGMEGIGILAALLMMFIMVARDPEEL
jgi:hypothetical protein